MRSFTNIAVACLLSLTAATPVDKRALVVHTVTEEVIETVDVTTTVWVKPTSGAHANYQIPAENQHHGHHHHHKGKPKTTTTSSQPYVAPVPVPNTPSTTSTTSTSSSSSTSVYVAPYTPPAVTTPKYTPPVVPTTVAPVVQPTTPAAPSPTISPSEGGSGGGSTGGACGEVGGSCSGDITYYEAGLGACGWTNDGSSEDVFALAHGMMGEQSNGNPFCGRMATIKVPGKPEVTAKLVDKCMGCEGQSIDLSNHLFDQLCDEATGRLHDVEWHFTS